MKDFKATKKIATELVGIYTACVVSGLFPGVSAIVVRPENMSIGEAIGGGIFFTLMTPITIAMGAGGILANTMYGIVALPRAIIKDLTQKDKPTISKNTSKTSSEVTQIQYSTNIIQQKLTIEPRQVGIAQSQFVTQHQELSLHTPGNNSSFQAVAIRHKSKPNLSLYTKHTREYLKSMEGKETIKEKIEQLFASLQAAGDALTQKELAALEQYTDAITANYVEYPVFLRDHFYDVETLEKLSKKEDPFTREPFEFSEVQSARILSEKFDEVLEEIMLNHPVLLESMTLLTASI
jgi:hypothetical protein